MDQYIQDYTKLINKFIDLPTQPYVYIMTQIPIQRDFFEKIQNLKSLDPD